MDSQRDVSDMGGTQRLGAYIAELAEGSVVAEAYGKTVVSERHRHRYEFNSAKYRRKFEDAGFRCSGLSPDGRLVEFIELPSHPFWVGTQAHPEFKSRPNAPAPLFRAFVGRRARPRRGPQPAPARPRPARASRPSRPRPSRRPATTPWASARSASASSTTGRVVSMRVGTFEAPDGQLVEREIVRHPGAVSAVAVDDEGRVVLVRQYRAALDVELLELPAGKLDEPGEDPLACVQRELVEEVGLEAADLGAAGLDPPLARASATRWATCSSPVACRPSTTTARASRRSG